jgi:hypothetical protein
MMTQYTPGAGTGTQRPFAPARGAAFGAFACPHGATPSAFAMRARVAPAVVTTGGVCQWDGAALQGTISATWIGQITAPIVGGQGRSAPIARRC